MTYDEQLKEANKAIASVENAQPGTYIHAYQEEYLKPKDPLFDEFKSFCLNANLFWGQNLLIPYKDLKKMFGTAGLDEAIKYYENSQLGSNYDACNYLKSIKERLNNE